MPLAALRQHGRVPRCRRGAAHRQPRLLRLLPHRRRSPARRGRAGAESSGTALCDAIERPDLEPLHRTGDAATRSRRCATNWPHLRGAAAGALGSPAPRRRRLRRRRCCALDEALADPHFRARGIVSTAWTPPAVPSSACPVKMTRLRFALPRHGAAARRTHRRDPARSRFRRAGDRRPDCARWLLRPRREHAPVVTPPTHRRDPAGHQASCRARSAAAWSGAAAAARRHSAGLAGVAAGAHLAGAVRAALLRALRRRLRDEFWGCWAGRCRWAASASAAGCWFRRRAGRCAARRLPLLPRRDRRFRAAVARDAGHGQHRASCRARRRARRANTRSAPFCSSASAWPRGWRRGASRSRASTTVARRRSTAPKSTALFQAKVRLRPAARYRLWFDARWLQLPQVQNTQSLREFLEQAPGQPAGEVPRRKQRHRPHPRACCAAGWAESCPRSKRWPARWR